MEDDQKYMQMAIDAAQKGEGWASPNPMVGAVIVKDGQILAVGYHHKCGDVHAEVDALRQLPEGAAQGATMYVTLEPCSHQGRQPPCCKAVVAAGLSRVVIAMGDPNPLVNGKGVEFLRAAGITVEIGLLAAEAARQNESFLYFITKKRPFVAMKLAQTIDGAIATSSGMSKWITGEEARSEGRKLRHKYDAILIGANTLRMDNPALTSRIPGARDPVKIVLSSAGQLPLDAQLFYSGKTIVATTEACPEYQRKELRNRGVELIICPSRDGLPDLDFLLDELGKKSISSLLVEGGSMVQASFLKAHLINKLYLFMAPRIIGGQNALHSVGDLGIELLDNTIDFEIQTVKMCGSDLAVEAKLKA